MPVPSDVSPYWHGVLCSETRGLIAERMRFVLDGAHFTLVTCNSNDENSRHFTSVDVYPSQRLTEPITEREDGIGWSTPELSMGVHTDARTRHEGLTGRPHKYVYFNFEPGRLAIEHYAPARYFLRWIFAVEDHETEGV
jgi:hypothetical protein